MSRRYNCRCGKKRYRDEAEALVAAASDRSAFGEAVTVYRCPGGLAWHLTTRGVLPEALRTAGRRLAAELLVSPVLDLDDYRSRVLRLDPVRDGRRWRRVPEVAAQMASLGIVDFAGIAGIAGIAGFARFAGGSVRALDPAALARVVQIGLDGYAAERAHVP